MNDRQKTIYVYAHWKKEPSFLGTMYVDSAKGRELFSFAYDEKWLKSPEANYFLDPDLHLYRGRQFVPMEKPIFGIFADSCPDRWEMAQSASCSRVIAGRSTAESYGVRA